MIYNKIQPNETVTITDISELDHAFSKKDLLIQKKCFILPGQCFDWHRPRRLQEWLSFAGKMVDTGEVFWFYAVKVKTERDEETNTYITEDSSS